MKRYYVKESTLARGRGVSMGIDVHQGELAARAPSFSGSTEFSNTFCPGLQFQKLGAMALR